MTQERFEELIDELEGNRAEVLKQKNAKYAPGDDALHNFHTGARLDGSTTCQTIWHYMKKHMVALLDKVEQDDWGDMDDVFEKMGDIMNYMDFLWCAAHEKEVAVKPESDVEVEERKGCCNCHWERCDEDQEPCSRCKYNVPNDHTEYKTRPLLWEKRQ